MIALDSRAEILLRYNLPFCDRVLQLSGKRNPTVRDFMHYTGWGRLENPWVGSPKDIADRLEEWCTAASTARSTPEPHCGIIAGWRALRAAHGDTDPVPVGAEIRPPAGVERVDEKVYQTVTRRNGLA